MCVCSGISGLQGVLHVDARPADTAVDGAQRRRKSSDDDRQPAAQSHLHTQGARLHGRRRRASVRRNTSQNATRRYARCPTAAHCSRFRPIHRKMLKYRRALGIYFGCTDRRRLTARVQWLDTADAPREIGSGGAS